MQDAQQSQPSCPVVGKDEFTRTPCIAWSTFSVPTCRDSITRHPAVPRERDGRGENRYAHKHAQEHQYNANQLNSTAIASRAADEAIRAIYGTALWHACADR